MKIKANAFALASSLTTATIYISGSILTHLFPARVLQLAAPLVHVTRFKLFRHLKPFFGFTRLNFVIALVELALYSYITSLLLATLYNFFAGYYKKEQNQ